MNVGKKTTNRLTTVYMQNFTTAFGSEVAIINSTLNFTDENNVYQSIPLTSIKSVEDNIKQLSQDPETLARKRKIFVSILTAIIVIVAIIIVYRFINPETVEVFRGGGRYLEEEISYFTPIFLLFVECVLILVLLGAKKVFKKSDEMERDDIQNKKDWLLSIKADRNGVIMPFQVCKGHASEIREIKQKIQSQTNF
jgi:hypothetical protein